MATVQGSTLYGGSLSKAAIYEIDKGNGLTWADHVKTEVNIDGKPRQLTRAEHAGNPISANIANPVASDFAGTATTTIDGRNLSVARLMVRDTFPMLQWKDTFPDFQPTGLNIDLKANPKILNVVFNRIMEATRSQINEIHALGDTTLISPSPYRWYDGYLKLILADADATEVGSGTALTSANILARIYALRNAVPPRLRMKANLKIFMSWEDFDLYDVARRSTQTQLAETDVIGADFIQQANGSKLNIVPVLGVPKDFMFVTLADKSDASNLKQGFWLENDIDAMQMYKQSPADQDWKIVFRFDIGVNYVTGKDIFYVQGV